MACRCEELLAGCTPLLHDLAALQRCSDLDTTECAYFYQLAAQVQQVRSYPLHGSFSLLVSARRRIACLPTCAWQCIAG